MFVVVLRPNFVNCSEDNWHGFYSALDNAIPSPLICELLPNYPRELDTDIIERKPNAFYGRNFSTFEDSVELMLGIQRKVTRISSSYSKHLTTQGA